MKEVISIKYEWSTLNCAKIMHLEQNSKFARCQNPYQLQTLNILLTFQEHKNPHGQNVWGLNIFYLKRQGYCVCVKYIMLCNCLCSSSSCFLLALLKISENLKQKIILQTIQQLLKYAVLEIQFLSIHSVHGFYKDMQKFRATFHSYSSDTTR